MTTNLPEANLHQVLTCAAELIAQETPTGTPGVSEAPGRHFTALVQAVLPYCYSLGEGPAYAIDPDKAAAAIPEWVPVSEGMPFEYEVVLVAGADSWGGFNTLSRTFFYTKDKGWVRNDTKQGQPSKEITHWMRLPAPPTA